MRSNSRKSHSIAAMVAAVALFSATPARAASPGTAEEAVAQFYVALNALFTGDMGPMERLWSHADDVTYMGPEGGFQVGWADVRARWESQAAQKLGGRVEPTDVHVTSTDTLAVAHNWEKGKNEGPDGPEDVSIRATSVFRKEDGVWKMIGHHTDLLPFVK